MASNSLDAPLSVPHNPLIAQSFYYRELFESWGRGIKLMADECRKHKVPMPEFHAFENNLVSMVFHIPEGVVLMENEHKNTPDDYKNDYEKERDEHKNDYEKEDVDYENDRENDRRNEHKNERRNDTKKQTKNERKNDTKNERRNGDGIIVLSARQKKILSLLKENNELYIIELEKRIGVSNATIRRDLRKMRTIVRHVGPKKGGHWEFADPKTE